jgi:hypothetical protein
MVGTVRCRDVTPARCPAVEFPGVACRRPPSRQMRPPPPSDARNYLEAAALCRAAKIWTGASATVAHRSVIGQGIRRGPFPITLVPPSQVDETTVVDRHTRSRG